MKMLGPIALAAALAGFTPTAFAQVQEPDPLACARTADGVGIRMGTEVVDAEGKRVGAVSLSQCSMDAIAGKLRVLMDARLGGEVRTFDLDGATATSSAVHLPVTSDEIAGSVEPRDAPDA